MINKRIPLNKVRLIRDPETKTGQDPEEKKFSFGCTARENKDPDLNLMKLWIRQIRPTACGKSLSLLDPTMFSFLLIFNE